MSNVTNDRLRGVDLAVAPGEIHGLAGVVGSGRTEMLQTVFGLRKVVGGELRIAGGPKKLRSPFDAIRLGVAMAPEDRHVQGLVLSHTIERNMALPRLSQLSRFGWFRRGASLQRSREAMKELAVKAPGPSTIVGNLSGGNQQKVVFGKWRDPTPNLLLLDEPTVGVDVGAREEIYGVVRRAAQGGTAVLVASSDLVELLLLCHRISVVVDGRIVKTVSRAELGNEEDLHHLIQESQSLAQESQS
jgi:ribose transport system ATP-binding protein